MTTEQRENELAELAARVVELEVRSAYQEDLIARLDEVVLQFTTRTEALNRTITELERRLSAAIEGESLGPPDDTPPHY